MSETRIIVSENDIRQVADEIKKQFHPDKVIIFGSYAGGEPTVDSDVDILIIMQSDLSVREAAYNIRKSINPAFPVDIIVRTPAQIEQRTAMGDRFIQGILEYGLIV